MSLYKKLIAAGIPTSNHCSDLYFPVTDVSRKIVQECLLSGEIASKPSTFTNQVEGGLWYDAAFMFDPYWEARQAK